MPPGNKQPTLCWSCAKAVRGCDWSREFIPIKGWNAIPTELHVNRTDCCKSFLVLSCPEFVRDAYNNGQVRLGDVKCD